MARANGDKAAAARSRSANSERNHSDHRLCVRIRRQPPRFQWTTDGAHVSVK
jgi:hypothetical protein